MSVLTDNTAKLRKILEKVENLPEIPESVAQATPSITVSSGGLITASATQEAGVVASGTKSATKQLTTKGGTTITPGDAEQTAVSAGTYVIGDIKVAAAAGGGQIVTGTITTTSSTQKTLTISPGFVVRAIFLHGMASEFDYGYFVNGAGNFYRSASSGVTKLTMVSTTESTTLTLANAYLVGGKTINYIAVE